MVLFSKTCILKPVFKSLHFQAPKTQLTLIVFFLHAALDDHKATYSISLCTVLLTEPTLWTRFVVSPDIPPLCTVLCNRSLWLRLEHMLVYLGIEFKFMQTIIFFVVVFFAGLHYFLLIQFTVFTISRPFVGWFPWINVNTSGTFKILLCLPGQLSIATMTTNGVSLGAGLPVWLTSCRWERKLVWKQSFLHYSGTNYFYLFISKGCTVFLMHPKMKGKKVLREWNEGE